MLINLKKKNKIVVIGDLILDEYNELKYVSQKNQMPVYHLNDRKTYLGGCGNVVSQLINLEQDVTLITRLGEDHSARQLVENLEKKSFPDDRLFIFTDSSIVTTTKKYYNTGFRIDANDGGNIPSFDMFVENVVNSLNLDELDAVILSDYDKGVFDIKKDVMEKIVSIFINHDIPIFVDSKREDIRIFSNCTFLKSNLEEFCYQVKIQKENFSAFLIQRKSEEYRIKNWIVTRDKEGVIAFINGKFYEMGTLVEAAASAVGAGDTFLAYFVVSFISDPSVQSSLKIASAAAAIQVENQYTYTVQLSEVQKKYGKYY